MFSRGYDEKEKLTFGQKIRRVENLLYLLNNIFAKLSGTKLVLKNV